MVAYHLGQWFVSSDVHLYQWLRFLVFRPFSVARRIPSNVASAPEGPVR